MNWYLLQSLIILALSTLSFSNNCIFNSSNSALNAATGSAASASIISETSDRGVVTFAPPASWRVSNEDISNRSPEFYDSLFSRQHNSQSYMWTSAENSQHKGAVLAHLVSCAVEMFIRRDEINHHSLCVSAVTGDPNQQSPAGRCNEKFKSYLLIGNDNETGRRNRIGTQACWCEPECTRVTASFQETLNNSLQTHSLKSFVVLDESDMHRTIDASEYESGTDNNNRPGTNWYEENLVNAQSPIGKGMFPRQGEIEAQGNVLRSHRIVNVIDQCPGVATILSDVEQRTMAKVEEQMSTMLSTTISSDLIEEPAKQSEIFLIISSSLTAVLAFNWYETAGKLLDKIKLRGKRRGKLLSLMGLILLVLVELAIENTPIYLLLHQEIRAKNHIETIAVEVIGVGNERGIFPLASKSEEQFMEMISVLVLMTVKNKDTSVTLITIAAVFLSVTSVIGIFMVIRKRLKRMSRVPLVMNILTVQTT